MNAVNPFVIKSLTMYSQSDQSTGGTRGYDPNTYVDTKLDRLLVPRIFDSSTKLVILTGNAGDGKTAFLQSIEHGAREQGATFLKETDNGCIFSIRGITYQTMYDGSQDFEGNKNDAILASFFHDFEGSKAPEGAFTKIIAINEGKLRDFILFRSQYKWLGNQVYHYLNTEGYQTHPSLIFVNLNQRSVVGQDSTEESIFDQFLNRFLDLDNVYSFWEDCKPEYCPTSEHCYIKYNVETFRDPIVGPEVIRRLRYLFLAVHFRKYRHITMRDLRSVISFILLNKCTCTKLQDDINTEIPIIQRFYYNSVFNNQETDRVLQLLAGLDVAAVSNPKLDNFVHFHPPDSREVQGLFIQRKLDNKADLQHLINLYNRRPEGTQDDDPVRRENARLYHASLRRKLFFEGDEEKLKSAGLPTWKEMLPYRQFDRFLAEITSKGTADASLRDELTLAISKSERVYNELVGREHLCLSSTSLTRGQTKAFYGFPASDFKVLVDDIGEQGAFIEYVPNCIHFCHTDKSARLEIPLDLFEILCKIREGYVPTASEIRTFFLNLEMFKRRVTAKKSEHIFLTEDDTNLFEIKTDQDKHIVMSKWGG